MITIRFFLILQKAVCPYEYMDDLKKLNETSLAEKIFLQSLNYRRYY